MVDSERKIFYGWYIVGIAFIAVGMAYGYRYIFGVFFPAMLHEFHWSRTALSAALSLSMLVNAVFEPVAGTLVDRYGPRWLLSAGAVLVGVALMLISRISELWQLYLIYGVLVAIGVNGMGIVVNTTMVNNWFLQKRGTALGILAAGAGVGTLIFSPLAERLIAAFGWRGAFIVLGLLVIVLVVPSTLFVAKTKPEDIGEVPDGKTSTPKPGSQPKRPVIVRPDVNLSFGEIVRSPAYYMLIASGICFAIAWFQITTHQVIYAVGLGISQANAAAAFGLVGGVSVIAKLGFGVWADRLYDRKYAPAVGLAFFALGNIILLMTKNVITLYVYAIVLGIGYGGNALAGTVLGDRFGRASFGKALGFMSVGTAIGAALGPVLGGRIYDVYQSYALAWQIGVALSIVAFLLMLFLPKTVSEDANKSAGIPQTN